MRRYLERSPQAPLSLRQVDPLIRELTQYRDLIQQRINFEEPNHEPDRTQSLPGATTPSGMAAVLETRLLQAQSEAMAPIDLISMLVCDELACRSKRLLERRHKQAQFRDPNKLLDNFDFQFNPKMNRSLASTWLLPHGSDGGKTHFSGPAGSGKSHCAQAIGHTVIQQGYRVLYREAHILLEELADATWTATASNT